MARPGIMLYFDIRQPLKALPDADKGRLLDAMLEYGEHGTEPDFEGMLALAWGFIKPKLDRDGESYETAKVQRKYAAFCKSRSCRDLPKISFEEWLAMDDEERQRMATAGNEQEREQRPVDSVNETQRTKPTTTTTAAATTTVTTTSTAAAAVTTTDPEEDATAAAADRQLKMMQGKLGKGVVALTEEQIEALLDELGVEMFDFYVDKLSTFILSNNARVKNHYETIRRWWREDSYKARKG